MQTPGESIARLEGIFFRLHLTWITMLGLLQFRMSSGTFMNRYFLKPLGRLDIPLQGSTCTKLVDRLLDVVV
jgi:hypothetical protein